MAAAGFTRRHFLITVAAGSAAAAALGAAGPARADRAMVDAAVEKLIGEANVADGAEVIRLDLPQIAENGNTVPLGVSIDSPMTADNHVKSVHVFADGNPNPDVVSFHFTPRSGLAEASTRMRLAQTQNIVAVAEMSDGKVYRAEAEVKVTIGGCGG
ncbi:thiosulfate oxidation carrier protein SoxY [Phormidium willei BDU 130791]|nr:thiosulfate oxidation carrier protein SoxY [Phormidium willei BDU 130791]